MKKFIASLLVVGITLTAGTQVVKACDCGEETITWEGTKYLFTIDTVEGRYGDYVRLESTINDATEDVYVGYFNKGLKLKKGEEVATLYDYDTLAITKIVEVDND